HLAPELHDALLELGVGAGEPGFHLAPELRQALLELRVERAPPRAPLCIKLREPLPELRVETREVQFVQLAQVGAVRGVHGRGRCARRGRRVNGPCGVGESTAGRRSGYRSAASLKRLSAARDQS